MTPPAPLDLPDLSARLSAQGIHTLLVQFTDLHGTAKGKALRGTALDPFGRTDERRTERALIGRYEARVRELLAALAVDASPRRRALAVQIASVPHTVRGFGHVKLANLALARVREAELLHRFDPVGYPQPAGAEAGVPVAGQFKGIRVTAG